MSLPVEPPADYGSISAIREAMGFSEEDLKANRAGEFSPAQRDDLEQRLVYDKYTWERSWGWLDPASKSRRLRTLWTTTSTLVFVIAVAACVRRAPQSGGPTLLLDVFAVTLGGALTLALFGWALSRFVRAHRPRDLLVLQSVEGVAQHDREESGVWRADILLVIVGETRLPVSAEVRACFVPGERYRVHYVERPQLLVLSAEPIGLLP